MVQSSGSVRFGKSLSSVRFGSVSQTISVRSVRFVFAKKQGFEFGAFGSGSVRFPSLISRRQINLLTSAYLPTTTSLEYTGAYTGIYTRKTPRRRPAMTGYRG